MARITRTRNRASPYSGGNSTWYCKGVPTGTSINPSRATYGSSCFDSYGSPVVDSPFNSTQYSGEYPWIDGKIRPSYIPGPTAVDEVRYAKFTITGLPAAMTGVTPLPAPSGWLLDLIAGTNPSRPVVNIPEMIENLVDLPKMLKNLGDRILSPTSKMTPKGLAGEYLGVQFGWLPLIEDLTKILDFQRYANKRNKELHQLYSGKGMRRRLKFADDTSTVVQTSTTNVSTSAISQACSLTIKREQWATIHWYPTTPPPYHPDDERWNRLSTQLVLGATPEAMLNGIWKVIPWTWMIGWFTNIGKYTLANSWTVPATHSAGCFMSKATATYESAGVSATNVTENSLNHGGKATLTKRTRAVSSQVTAGVNMPYLDMFRLSILGALFTQKFLK